MSEVNSFMQIAGGVAPQAQPAAAPLATQPNEVDMFSQIASGGMAKKTQGPSIGPQGASENLHPEDISSDPFTRAGLKLTTPFARKAMDAIDKLHEVENFTQEGAQQHPVQAFMGHIANRLEGFLFGNEQHPEDAIGTGKYGMLNNPALAATTMPEAGEGAINAVREGVSSLRAARVGGEAAESEPGIVEQILKGKELEQEPAQAAVRTATKAPEGTSLLEGNKSVVDKPIRELFTKERAAYAKQDKIAGFDMQALHDKLEATEEQIRNLTETEEDVAKEAKLEKSRTAIMDKISEAEGKLKAAGVDPEEAKGIYQQRKAAEDFKKIIVRHTSPDGESVNVDGLLEASKKLRFNKYGDRLEQFLGKDGADKFMSDLQKAKELGAHSMKAQEIAKKVGKYIGYGAGIGLGGHVVHELVQ